MRQGLDLGTVAGHITVERENPARERLPEQLFGRVRKTLATRVRWRNDDPGANLCLCDRQQEQLAAA